MPTPGMPLNEPGRAIAGKDTQAVGEQETVERPVGRLDMRKSLCQVQPG